MPTYTFRGRDMSEAVEQVRNTLGSDAVIVDTLRGTDHIGRFVEITANGELKSALQSTYPEPEEASRAPSIRGRQLTRSDMRAPAPPRSGRVAKLPREGEIISPSAARRNVQRREGYRPVRQQQESFPPPQPTPRPSRQNHPMSRVKGAERYQPPFHYCSIIW